MICAIHAPGAKTHFDISDHFVISEFDLEGVRKGSLSLSCKIIRNREPQV